MVPYILVGADMKINLFPVISFSASTCVILMLLDVMFGISILFLDAKIGVLQSLQ